MGCDPIMLMGKQSSNRQRKLQHRPKRLNGHMAYLGDRLPYRYGRRVGRIGDEKGACTTGGLHVNGSS